MAKIKYGVKFSKTNLFVHNKKPLSRIIATAYNKTSGVKVTSSVGMTKKSTLNNLKRKLNSRKFNRRR